MHIKIKYTTTSDERKKIRDFFKTLPRNKSNKILEQIKPALDEAPSGNRLLIWATLIAEIEKVEPGAARNLFPRNCWMVELSQQIKDLEKNSERALTKLNELFLDLKELENDDEMYARLPRHLDVFFTKVAISDDAIFRFVKDQFGEFKAPSECTSINIISGQRKRSHVEPYVPTDCVRVSYETALGIIDALDREPCQSEPQTKRARVNAAQPQELIEETNDSREMDELIVTTQVVNLEEGEHHSYSTRFFQARTNESQDDGSESDDSIKSEHFSYNKSQDNDSESDDSIKSEHFSYNKSQYDGFESDDSIKSEHFSYNKSQYNGFESDDSIKSEHFSY